MRYILDRTSQRLRDISQFMDAESKLLNSATRLIGWRQSIYAGVLISTSAALEEFIDSLFTHYADEARSFFPVYESLPDSVKKHHDTAARNLLSRGSISGRVTKDDADEIARALVSCLDAAVDYRLSPVVMRERASNLRIDILREGLARLGVQLDQIESKLYSTESWGELLGVHNDLENFLDDFISRRNTVAHSYESEILDRAVLRTYVGVVEQLCFKIFEYYARQLVVSSPCFVEIAQVENYYHKIDVHAFKLENRAKISRGDVVVGELRDGGMGSSRVLSLQYDGTNLHSVIAKGSICIGVKTDPGSSFRGNVFRVDEKAFEAIF
ncbi:MAE_28990/MAE_18760 family HEPN-like nuclease [Rhodococcus sp. 077-4]|uniref:MAE_28990/MAE_18760 family HEPN-like nuclease n=1 Tax=Rhodococcus sp. 077-4 TaxID=2789271 RepID=UPI0039F4C8D6